MMATSMVQAEQRVKGGSKAKVWIGRALSGLAVAFLLVDSVGKLMAVRPVVESSERLGYPGELTRGTGMLLLACVAAYVIPRTSVLGAILLTGYLGGAVAIHVRIGAPLFTHTLFPVYFGAMIWGGLALRDDRLRALLPLRR